MRASKKVKDSKLPKEVSELKRLQEEAEEISFYLFDKHKEDIKEEDDKSYTETELHDLMLKIHQNLKFDHLSYNFETELLSSQEILCNFGMWLISLLDDVDETNLGLFYNCIKLLMYRQELKLSAMAYAQEYKT